ncbi:MAG: molybdenum cofactor guanylyltransferase [Bacteroidia bacterium]|nr:molybdenum cofactor guanylyltransferase [Bacteroidia bacterium]
MDLNAIDIFITAGGKSTRMGQDKGLLSIEGKPMITHLTDRLTKHNYSFTIIANKEEYKKLGYPVINDIVVEKGPMGALHTAFNYTVKDFVLLLGCDTPFLPIEVIERLIKNVKNKSVTVAEFNSSIHPLHAIYHVSLKNKILSCTIENKLKMQDLIFQSEHCLINMDDLVQKQAANFFNLNEPKDLLKWKIIQ